ncbi:LytR/AlgR family response regulator transcription factor [Lewinella sp. LCG006]|uniref:LytR/AlgR family response regulator transcription factor n=1 Tax=Lewinella sp. LCG006 TaxID=3231911 RepID=UPI0034606E09
MKCLIVDDEELAVKVIENHIQQIDGMEVAGVCYNAMDAFTFLQKQAIDLVFLDIQMPKISGLSLLKSIPNKPPVILTTAHREFALEGFELDVVDYLLKPISLDRFLKSVGKIYRLQQKTAPVAKQVEPAKEESATFFYIKSDRQFIKILLAEVLYIESLRNHVKIVTTTGNHTTLLGISQMEQKLPPQHFTRIHRSYLVALTKVDRFTQTNLTIGKKTLPIGQNYREEVLQRLQVDLI